MEFDDLHHLEVCDVPTLRCAHCLYLAGRFTHGKTWLRKGTDGYSCHYCARQGVLNLWGKQAVTRPESLTKFILDRHERSRLHNAATSSKNLVEGIIVPSMKQFKAQLHDVKCFRFTC